jgi:hypothetical protein
MRQFTVEIPDLSETYVAVRGTSWEALDRELSRGLLTRRDIDEEPENFDENIGIRLVREGT